MNKINLSKIEKIFIIGAGYVGLANGIALAKNYKVVFCDIDSSKLNAISKGFSPLKERDLELQISKYKDNISAISQINSIEKNDLVIICLPTDLDLGTMTLSTKLIEETIANILRLNNDVNIVIRSTVPIGFTKKMITNFSSQNIHFAPEFLREGQSYKDVVYPSRLIIGSSHSDNQNIIEVLSSVIDPKHKFENFLMSPSEAETVKLFSNSYLAMRVSFFNELDTFAHANSMDARNIISGICSDERIGNFYNNPSFGFGGYCLPKDSQQLQNYFQGLPASIIPNIASSNSMRIQYIHDQIIKLKKKKIGFFRLNNKEGSDNLRDSISYLLLNMLKDKVEKIYIFEPLHDGLVSLPMNAKLVDSVSDLAKKSQLIIANRNGEELYPYKNILFTRDIFNIN